MNDFTINTAIPDGWTNTNNKLFYETVPLEALRERAVLEGLDICYDIDQIMGQISPYQLVVEIGAGYGRAIAHLRSHGFRNLVAIERSLRWIRRLKEVFGDKISVNPIDMQKLTWEQNHCNAMLWLWDGIADFAKSEQPIILRCMIASLKRKGKIFIDVSDPKPANSISSKGQEHAVQVGEEVIYGYYPTVQELLDCCAIPAVKDVEIKQYHTYTGKKRMLCTIEVY